MLRKLIMGWWAVRAVARAGSYPKDAHGPQRQRELPISFRRCLLGATACYLLAPRVALAEPTIAEVSGSYTHREEVVISGSGFGTKSPAAPLIWDDGEQNENGDDPVADGAWDRTAPGTVLAGVGDEFLTKYRAVPYRGTAGPHDRSHMYIAGGHDEQDCDDHTGRNVMVEKSADATTKTWWALWYVRLDPAWPSCEGEYPDCNGLHNFKDFNIESTTGWYDPHHIYSGCNGVCNDSDYMSPRPSAAGGTIFSGGTKYCYSIWDDTCDANFDISDYDSGRQANPRFGWIHQEMIVAKNHVGVYGRRAYADWLNDNSWAYYLDGVPDFEFDSPEPWDMRSSFVGGFYRYCECSGGGYHLHDDAFRYFDDLYMDTTLARVLLANHADYEQATIVEPQIPSAWSDTEIAVTVNLGKLPDNATAYLFVFDADNQRNATGYPVVTNGPGTGGSGGAGAGHPDGGAGAAAGSAAGGADTWHAQADDDAPGCACRLEMSGARRTSKASWLLALLTLGVWAGRTRRSRIARSALP